MNKVPYENRIRLLCKTDYYKDFMSLLNQLTPTHTPTYDEFCSQFNLIKDEIYVIEDNNKIIATGKLIVEHKFHNNFSNMGHIEDVVVHKEYRQQGLGKLITNFLSSRANAQNCYKVILNCSKDNISFYEKCGFKQKGTEMVIYSN
jgi:glucosamine-phosphate N-acetyltransferase